MNGKFVFALILMSVGFLAHFWFDEKIIDESNDPCPFPYPHALPFYCSFFNVICALCILLFTHKNFQQNPLPYFGVASLMTLTTFASTMGKLKIDYASLNVFKSAKPVAIMILSIFLYRNKVPFQRIISVLCLCISIVIFRLQGIEDGQKAETTGYIFIAIELLTEGLYSPLVDKLNKKTNNPYITMLYTHFGKMIILFLTNSSSIIDSFLYLEKTPAFIPQILGLVLTGGIAQIALFTVVGMSDGLILSIATTTRKFLTIVISSLYFHHNFTVVQWLCVISVFASLGYDIFSKKSNHDKQKKD